MVYLKFTNFLSLSNYPNVASANFKIIGLIAGRGQFPFLFARAARDQGIKIIAAGVKGDTSPFLYFLVDKFQYFKVGELKKLFEYFRRHDVTQVIMAGQVNQDPFNNVTWELYDLTKDWTQYESVAEKFPNKVKEMKELFQKEAKKYEVLPLDATVATRLGEYRFHP